jgi:hypothetical protein
LREAKALLATLRQDWLQFGSIGIVQVSVQFSVRIVQEHYNDLCMLVSKGKERTKRLEAEDQPHFLIKLRVWGGKV